jgi:hypothetical protein
MPSVKPTTTSINPSTAELIASAARGVKFHDEARDKGTIGDTTAISERIKDIFNMNLLKYTMGLMPAPQTNLRDAKPVVERIMRAEVPILIKRASDARAELPIDKKPDAIIIMLPVFFHLTKTPTNKQSDAFLYHFCCEQDEFFESLGCDYYDATWLRDIDSDFCQITICAVKRA